MGILIYTTNPYLLLAFGFALGATSTAAAFFSSRPRK
jgi:hypothetical protein